MSSSQDPNMFLPGSQAALALDKNGLSNLYTIADPSQIVLSNNLLVNLQS